MSVADSGLADMLAMLDQDLSGLVVANAALGPLTTYRVGGAARRFVTVENDEQLDRVARVVARSKVPVLVVGRGSNLLVADRGFDGLAVQLGERYGEINISGTIVRAGGAASLPVVARRTAAAGLTGFEWAVGVPGSIGGAVRMNAGGHGSDIAASLARVRVLDLAAHKDVVVTPDALALEYRSSIVGPRQVVVWAELELDHGDPAAAEAEVNEIVRWRRTNQPGGQNAGSVFTNPPGDSAGRLIDEAGPRVCVSVLPRFQRSTPTSSRRTVMATPTMYGRSWSRCVGGCSIMPGWSCIPKHAPLVSPPCRSSNRELRGSHPGFCPSSLWGADGSASTGPTG